MDLGLDGGNEAMNWFSAPDNIAIAWQLSACLPAWLTDLLCEESEFL
jgi:hypothetical protein